MSIKLILILKGLNIFFKFYSTGITGYTKTQSNLIKGDLNERRIHR